MQLFLFCSLKYLHSPCLFLPSFHATWSRIYFQAEVVNYVHCAAASRTLYITEAPYQQCIAKTVFAKTSSTPWGFPYTHTMQKAVQCYDVFIFHPFFCLLCSDRRLYFGDLMGVKSEWISWQ